MPSTKKKVTTVGLVVLLLAFSGVAVTGTVNAQIGSGMMGSINPGMIGGLFGNMFIGELEGMGQMFEVMFNNATELFAGKDLLAHTYVFNVSGDRSLNSYSYSENAAYKIVYNTSSGGDPGLWVESKVQRNVFISGEREYLTVFIFWDPDDSLKDFIELLAQSIETMSAGGSDPTDMIAVVANLIGALINFNSIFTGDEVFTLCSFIVDDFTAAGDYSIENTWYNSSDPSDPFAKDGYPDIAGTDVNQTGHPMYFYTRNVSGTGSFEDHKAYQMWMVQLHIRELFISMDFSKLESGDPSQIFRDVEIGFDIMTHRVTGLHIFNDTNSNGIMDLAWVYNTSYETGDPYGQSAKIDASENKYNYNIKDFDELTIIDPYIDGNSIAFGMNMSGVQGSFLPFGTKEIDHNSGIENSGEIDANTSQLTHIVHFTPSIAGLPTQIMTGAATMKIDHVIGNWTVGNSTDQYDDDVGISNFMGLQNESMGLALSYSSLIFNFDFKYVSSVNRTMNEFALKDGATVLDRANYTGKVNGSTELDVGINIALGLGGTEITDIDLTGPVYDQTDPTDNTTIADNLEAKACILPLAQLVFNMGVEGMNASLGVSLNLDTFLYSVAYANWRPSLTTYHDPVFTVHTSVNPVFPTIAVVVLVVIIAVAALAIIIHKKKE
ncbi:MAG: hypothetical protein EAX96_18690 [Candidatus Lokiarchaeota archaeon]|nr:hypothetical protein [Candidatus Lokiarchaeota archaeon]